MKDKKFEIVGEVDNIEIPEEKPEPSRDSRRENGGFRLRITKENIVDFIEGLKRNNGRPPKPSDAEIQIIMKQTGIPKQELIKMLAELDDIFADAMNGGFLEELSNMVEEKGDDLTQHEIDKAFDTLFANVEKRTSGSSLEEEDEDEIELPDELESDTLNIEALIGSYGVVVCEDTPNILELFKEKYGEFSTYSFSIFQPEIKVSNVIAGLADIVEFEIVDSTSKFILAKAIPASEEFEPIYVALTYFEGNFEMVVPEFGNSFNPDTGDLFSKEKDSDLFVETPRGTVLMKPADLSKIKVGLELALFENKKPITSIKDFGTVFLKNEATFEVSSEVIHMGRIKSNEEYDARQFKEDFNLDIDETYFEFYVKLKKEYSAKTLDNIFGYLTTIDFNENPKIQSCELKVSKNKNLYIEIDLDGLPDNVDKWVEE